MARNLVLPLGERTSCNLRSSTAQIAYTSRALLALVVAISCMLSPVVDVPTLAAATSKEKKKNEDPVLKGLPITELSSDEGILHALNRLAYGPRPGDVERVRQMGLAKWIDQQLNPKTINDTAVEARLNVYPTLTKSTARLLAEYPNPKQAAKLAERGKPAPEPLRAAQKQADEGVTAMARETEAENGGGSGAQENSGTMVASAAPADTPSPMKLNPATKGAGGKKDVLGMDPNVVPPAISDDSKRPQRVVEELAMAKMTRAIYSDRQLQQVMDDFWLNHFNVFAGKGEVKWYLTSYERDVIQPNALGKFKDLVTGTAKSPAMLFYLDNFLSADPKAAQRQAMQRAARPQMRRYPPRQQAQQGQNKKQQRGLNENYGRELMELHTLGVDGGYTQKDVTEVARCFTGWTIEKPREVAQFKFDEKVHDPDPKVVLGKKIHAGGMKDGEQVIDLLVKNLNTAKFISTKLARRFVSDTPPPALVERMAKSFQKSGGDVREVLRTMIYSPEFWSREAYRAKVKTPYELVVSSARALGTEVDTPMPLVQWVGRIGEPLYQCQPPTGYSDKAETWVNSGALLNRLNFSLALAGNKVRGSRSDVAALLGSDNEADPKKTLNRAVELFLGEAGQGTVDTLQKQLENPQVVQAKLDDPVKQLDLGVLTGLVLGAPEFQRR
jgi:uncharacterized protein (DUF1800 family)